MVEKVGNVHPPRGLARLAFRLPTWLYRLGLGWVLGYRFLYLTHIGRRSGQPRHTVLEMVRYDQVTTTCIVASGFGEKSDWCRNIIKNPKITVQVKRKCFPAYARRLNPDEAGKEMRDYARRHPRAIKELAKFMGYRLDGSEADVHAMGQRVPMFAFEQMAQE